ncbi:MAG: NAD(P)/FAD-dependent oxidoreductase [Sphingomonadales bacterium]|nr:NAD(P)/FAD-dependent oxidoreductase [Sphingomonadales bacterium]MBK6720982.1 NAD(P)/FAD-dependent oxidoreductase [Sphingomonadales bacterium]MBK8272691.1 NAD(P)/FAD-dependent oxidoreductase [Sphingomonadales bacterium]MBL0116456.1 NAD(P)/FAD-dependent oxidoreductase [Sphingomonadales bacterium]
MTQGPETFDAIILGAGGAGMMCGATAGQRGKAVLIVDHAEAPGKKILISGGGRCNFTNVFTGADRYISANPHFAKSALGRYRPEDFIALVEAHRIAWHEKTLGQLFCDGSARQIVDMLLEECAAGKVNIALGEAISSVDHADGLFRIAFGGRLAAAPALVIATGGLSIPKMGATGFAYDLARKFGLKVVEPRPALVPFTLGPDDALFTSLSGVSADVIARTGKTAFREAALFTHRGLSGPAILQVSSYWRHRDPVEIDFLPDQLDGWLRALKRDNARLTLRRALSDRLPDRLAQALADRIGATGELGEEKDAALAQVERQLARWPFHPNGTEGFAKAEVTVGGIATDGLSSQTMEARRLPGLYAIGEAVDVTGWLGGYNFQWAWASGVAAGQAV